MTDFLTYVSARSSGEGPKSPEERILEAIFGPRPISSVGSEATAITAASVQEDFDKVLTSLDRSEARMRVLQDELWMNRREIENGLERIRAANDRNEAALKTLARDG